MKRLFPWVMGAMVVVSMPMVGLASTAEPAPAKPAKVQKAAKPAKGAKGEKAVPAVQPEKPAQAAIPAQPGTPGEAATPAQPAAPAVPAKPAAKPGAMYTLETTPASFDLATGAKGTVNVTITPAADNHVNDEPTAPFSIVLKGEGLTFEKEKLGHADVKHTPEATTVAIPFTAAKAGTTSFEATLKFFVCTPKTCVPQSDRISIPVTVK